VEFPLEPPFRRALAWAGEFLKRRLQLHFNTKKKGGTPQLLLKLCRLCLLVDEMKKHVRSPKVPLRVACGDLSVLP
jgi:hypothetical protein